VLVSVIRCTATEEILKKEGPIDMFVFRPLLAPIVTNVFRL
jgi:hypothetical protein